jgi:hypothetical protein
MIKETLAFLLENSCSESSILETLNLQSSWITLLRGDAPWRSNFVGEKGAGGLFFCSGRLFMVAALPLGGKAAGGRHRGRARL